MVEDIKEIAKRVETIKDSVYGYYSVDGSSSPGDGQEGFAVDPNGTYTTKPIIPISPTRSCWSVFITKVKSLLYLL